jgi:hypothetical protein
MDYFFAVQCSKGHWIKAHKAKETFPASKTWKLVCPRCEETVRARETALQNRRMKVKRL